MQVHAILYTLLNEHGLISKIIWKLGRIWRLLRNWLGIPSLVTDTVTACIRSYCGRDTHASACKCTSIFFQERNRCVKLFWNNMKWLPMWICAGVVSQEEIKVIQMRIVIKREGKYKATATRLSLPSKKVLILSDCNLCSRAARAQQRLLAAGCLVQANPPSPEARLLGHVGMKAATGWHAAQGPGSNPQLGASISRMNMSICSGRCWEAEYENRCWWQQGRGRDWLAWMNDGKDGGVGQ